MAAKGGSSGPLSPYDREQARLIAAYERKQTEIAERKDRLLDQFGKEFANIHEIKEIFDPETRKMAVDNLAADLAKQGVNRPDKMEWRDYLDARQRAVSQANDAEDLRYKAESSGQQPATPARAPEGDPQREPERDPRQQQAQTPERQAEATPERFQERDPAQRPIGLYDEMKQQHAEIVAKNAPQEQGQAEEKQLRFSEDREQRGNSLDHNEERSDAKQAERPESGEKKLSFFEDKNPSQPNDIEH